MLGIKLCGTPSNDTQFLYGWEQGGEALGNNHAHICRPLNNLERGWWQMDEDLLVESHAHVMQPALLGNAILVCNYGGIIRIRGGAEEG